MRRFVLSFTAVALLLGSARADDAEARKIVAEAVKAHGGADLLAKFKDKASISKGKIIIPALDNLEAKMETFAGSKKFKQVVDLKVMGQDINQIVVYDGKELWIAINGKIMITLSKPEELAAIRETIFAEEAAGLALLGSKDIELAIIGESKIDDAPVMGVRVSAKDHKDVSLYFDKKTHLLRKIESRGLDFQTQQEVGQERLLSDYKEIDGMKRPTRVTIFNDGKKTAEVEILETKVVDKLDDDTFDKPK